MELHDNGLDDLFGDVLAEADAAGDYALQGRNTAPYAGYVQDLDNYEVVSEAGLADARDRHADRVLDADAVLTTDALVDALDEAGDDEVDRLRAYTSATTPDGRPAHPGGWGDVDRKMLDQFEAEAYPPGFEPPPDEPEDEASAP